LWGPAARSLPRTANARLRQDGGDSSTVVGGDSSTVVARRPEPAAVGTGQGEQGE
jgi:hypothetical protein